MASCWRKVLVPPNIHLSVFVCWYMKYFRLRTSDAQPFQLHERFSTPQPDHRSRHLCPLTVYTPLSTGGGTHPPGVQLGVHQRSASCLNVINVHVDPLGSCFTRTKSNQNSKHGERYLYVTCTSTTSVIAPS